jgi:ribosomal protein S15P/S13E
MPKIKKEKTEESAKIKDSEDGEKDAVKKKTETKKLSESEFEKKVIELANQGLTSEKIGEELRKKGIHTKEYSRKISKILKEKGIYVSPDLKNVESKLGRINSHYQKNKQDKRAKREKDRVFSQIRKIKKYLKLPLK